MLTITVKQPASEPSMQTSLVELVVDDPSLGKRYHCTLVSTPRGLSVHITKKLDIVPRD